MARGKHATASFNRANDAARDHIDRLTSQLAEQKMRARDAEERARESDLLRERIAHLDRQIEDDELLKKFLKTWDPLASDLHSIHKLFAGLKRAFYRSVVDVMTALADATFTGGTVLGYADVNEFVIRRYPEFGHVMPAGRDVFVDVREDRKILRLSDDQVRRLQRIRGERGAFAFKPDSTVAEVLVDLLEALEADLRNEDLEEYIGLWESEWTEIAAKRALRRSGMTKKEVDAITDDQMRGIPSLAIPEHEYHERRRAGS